MSVPVVILPLDPQSVDVDDDLSNLGINDSLLKIVLVHETSQSIVPVNVEFQKIAHASDSSLAISLATDGDSLQGIPPLQSVADSLQRIPLILSVGTHPVPRLVMVLLRDPITVFSYPSIFAF